MQWRCVSHGEVKIEKTDGSCSRQKEYDFIVLVHGNIRPGSGRRAFHHGYSVLGRSVDKKMESRAKRSLGEAESGGPNVETGEGLQEQ